MVNISFQIFHPSNSSFLDGTCTVFSRNGALTPNGDKVPGSTEYEGERTHDNMLSAIQDVQARINKKIQYGGYTLEDCDGLIQKIESTPTGSSSPDHQINQKRSAISQGFDPLAKESLLNHLHTEDVIIGISKFQQRSHCFPLKSH